VTETGWGEFNVGMRIIFTDPTLPHMDIIHPLKLYPPSKL
jgi:transcription initiation factor IIF auxiliary subunit